MKQRLCLAKVLLHDPPVLILDEPANALDPRARVELKSLLGELRQAGKTVLVSSHVLSELADCCTTVGIIERGKLLLHGPIEEIYRRIGRKRVLEIRLLEPVETALGILQSNPKVSAIHVDGLSVTVEVEADDAEVAGLLNHLVTEGARVLSFTEKDLSLEEVFMWVTKGVVG
jgi:ABC-2 type transport system ATP-binding protein